MAIKLNIFGSLIKKIGLEPMRMGDWLSQKIKVDIGEVTFKSLSNCNNQNLTSSGCQKLDTQAPVEELYICLELNFVP